MAQYNINFSTNASQAAREIDRVNQELTKVIKIGQSIKLNLDTSSLSTSINTTFSKLNKEIENSQRKLDRLRIGSRRFQERATGIGVAEGIRERGALQSQSIRLGAQAEAFDIGSTVRLQKQLQALRIDASQIAPNTIEWVEFQRQIAQINLELSKSDKLAEDIQLRENLGAFAPGSLAQLEAKLTLLRNKAREITPNTTGWKQLNKEIQQLEGGISRANKKPLSAGQRAGAAGGAFLYGGGLGGGVGSAVGGIAGGLAGGVPGAFAGAAVGQIADNLGTALAGITSQASAVQKMQRGLAMASVDAKDFAEAQAAVGEMSQKLLMPLEQTTKYFAQLRANAKEYNLSVDETRQILEGTALAIMATGGSAEDLDGAMRAVVQIMSKGGVQAEELRGQLGERFPGAVVKFAQANKMSFEELQQGLESGQIGIREFIEFAKKNYTDYAKFSEQLATAPEYAGQRLKIAFEQLSLEIGSLFGPMGADIQDTLTEIINGIAGFIKENRGYLRQMMSDFGSILGPIAKVFIELLKVVANFSIQVGKVFQSLFSQIRQALGMASIGEAKARLDRAKAATAGKTKPKSSVRGGGPFQELALAQQAFNALGGQAAFDKANAPAQPSNLTFGGAGAGMSIDREGGGSGRGKGKEPKTYTSDLAKQLQQEMQIRINAINQDASLSDREREIQEAAMRYNYEILMNKAEYHAAVNDKNNKDILNRKQYLTDLDKTLQAENKLSQQRFEDVVTRPLRGALEEDREAIIDLEGSIASLAKGQSEQTNVEKRQALIKKASVGLDKEAVAALQPLFDLILQVADARDKLTKAEKEAQKVREKLEDRDEYIKSLQSEVKLLLILDDIERRRAELREKYGDDEKKIQEIIDLEAIKKNIEDTRALIGDFVSSTTSDYKGFLKAVISGEDAVDALKQFQEGLKDRVLTIFLDFAMAPVEKFFKESLEALFLPEEAKGLKPEEEQAKTGIEGNTVATNENTAAIKDLTAAINGGEAASPASAVPGGGTGGGFDAANVFGGGGNLTGGIFDTIAQQMGGATESFDSFSAHMGKFVDSSVASADAVGSWGDSFNTQLSESLTKATDTSDKQGFNFQESLGKAVGAIGIAAGSIMGIASGISQIKEGGTANVLGGIGSILTSVGGGIMGFMGMFGANGGVAPKGWQPFPVTAFANGGMVTGPTLGLVGEGKYNEAIVPLPDGRSIPVQMTGTGSGSLRDAMGQAPGQSSAPILNMSFESTNINGVEYVSRDQLEQAMAQTRRQASRDGAQRGMSMTLDKLQQSPSTRSRIGIR